MLASREWARPGRRRPTGETVAVTGSAGFIGSHTVARLREGGHSVRGFDLRADDPAGRCDIRVPLDAARFAGARVAVHLAALGGVAASLRCPGDYWQTNVAGTRHVAAAARAAGVGRLVVVSSSSVYGECPSAAHEDRPPAPMSPYAASKLAAEAVAADHAGTDLEVVVVRPFSVYGPRQRRDMLVGRLLRGEPVTLWPFERDLTPVDAVARGIVAACLAPMESPFEVFNLGAGHPVGAATLLAAIEEATGRPPRVAWGPARPCEPQRTWADRSRASRLLGVQPGADLLTTIVAQHGAQMQAGRTGSRGPRGSRLSPRWPCADHVGGPEGTCSTDPPHRGSG